MSASLPSRQNGSLDEPTAEVPEGALRVATAAMNAAAKRIADLENEVKRLRRAIEASRTNDSWYRDGLRGWSQEARDAYATGFAEAADYIEAQVDGDV